jgi:anti-sigma B factor antagonist
MAARVVSLRHHGFRVTVAVRQPVLQVALLGELDLAGSNLLDAVTRTVTTGVTEVAVDLSGLSFCDSQGFQLLESLHESHGRAGRTVRLLHSPPCVLRIAEIVRRSDLLVAS